MSSLYEWTQVSGSRGVACWYGHMNGSLRTTAVLLDRRKHACMHVCGVDARDRP